MPGVFGVVGVEGNGDKESDMFRISFNVYNQESDTFRISFHLMFINYDRETFFCFDIFNETIFKLITQPSQKLIRLNS